MGVKSGSRKEEILQLSPCTLQLVVPTLCSLFSLWAPSLPLLLEQRPRFPLWLDISWSSSKQGMGGGDLAYLGSPTSQTRFLEVRRFRRKGLTLAPAQRGTHGHWDFPEGTARMNTTRWLELLCKQGSSKCLASFDDGKVNIFKRPSATTLTPKTQCLG